jgi:hypothetical protein
LEQAGSIAVGVHLAGGLGGRQQGLTGSLRLAPSVPVLGREACSTATPFELLGKLPVERTAAGPGNVAVDRVADQCVSEGGRARASLDEQALRECLTECVVTIGEARHEVWVELRACHGSDLQRRPCRLTQSNGTQQHDVANGVRDG